MRWTHCNRKLASIAFWLVQIIEYKGDFVSAAACGTATVALSSRAASPA
jgi:hypothetical protein